MFRARARGARVPWLLLGAVLAVLLACMPPAGAGSGGVRAGAVQAGGGRLVAAPVQAAPVQAAPARAAVADEALAPVPVPAVVFAGPEATGQGPACAPGPPERGPLPAAPPRGAGDQGHVPPARVGAERAWDGQAIPVRVFVRGPDLPAPSALELSVMRV